MSTILLKHRLVLLDETADVLETARPGDLLWHWYLDEGVAALPCLLLKRTADLDARGFLQAVGEIVADLGTPGPGPRSFGMVELRPAAPVRIVAERPDPEFADRLAELIEACSDVCPPLRRLAGFTYGRPDQEDALGAHTAASVPEGHTLASWLALADVAAALRLARVGDTWRFAFLRSEDAPVLLAIRRLDQGFDAFRETCARVAVAMGREPDWVLGRLVLDDGTATVQVPRAHRDFLPELATWVTSNLEHAPELGRLIPARLEMVDEGWKKIRSVTDPALWADVDAPPVRPDFSTLRRLDDVLRQLEPGDKLRFLFTPRGFNAAPVLVLSTEKESAAFRRECVQALGGVSPKSTPVIGVARVSEDGGRLAFRSKKNVRSFLQRLSRFVGQSVDLVPSLQAISHATFEVVGDDGGVIHTYDDPSVWEAAR